MNGKKMEKDAERADTSLIGEVADKSDPTCREEQFQEKNGSRQARLVVVFQHSGHVEILLSKFSLSKLILSGPVAFDRRHASPVKTFRC